jgi:hypothetical protein
MESDAIFLKILEGELREISGQVEPESKTGTRSDRLQANVT